MRIVSHPAGGEAIPAVQVFQFGRPRPVLHGFARQVRLFKFAERELNPGVECHESDDGDDDGPHRPRFALGQ